MSISKSITIKSSALSALFLSVNLLATSTPALATKPIAQTEAAATTQKLQTTPQQQSPKKINLFKIPGAKKAWLTLQGLAIVNLSIYAMEAALDISIGQPKSKFSRMRVFVNALSASILGARRLYRDYHDTSDQESN